MKTIRMQNQVSIGRFLKRLATVVFISYFVLFCVYIIHIRFFYYQGKIYETNEEIVKMFKTNREDFDNMVDLLKETDVIAKLNERYLTQKKITYPTGDSLSNPYEQLLYSGFVSSDQFKEMVDFFEKYRLYNIDFEWLGQVTFYMFFFNSKQGGLYLIYSDNEQDISKDIMSRYSFIKPVSRLYKHWYCGYCCE